MKVLVTGAAGFIGSHVVEVLARDGHEIRGFDLGDRPAELPDTEWIQGDVTDPEAARAAVSDCEAVCHLAAAVGDWGPEARYLKVNVGGTENLLKAASDAGVRRFVLVSSVAVHHYRGFRNGDETAPRDGHMNPYCRSKVLAEDRVRSSDLEWVIARPGVFPFGPRDRTSFVHLAKAMEKGVAGVVNGGRAVLCTAYVENLAHGLALCVTHPDAARQIFVLADPWEVTWKDLFTRFTRALGVRDMWIDAPMLPLMAPVLAWELLYRALDIQTPPTLTRYRLLVAGRDCHFTSEKARRILGFQPQVDLDEAVRRTVAWYRGEG